MNQPNRPFIVDETTGSIPNDRGDHFPSLSVPSPEATMTIDQEKSWEQRVRPFITGTIFLFSAFFFLATAYQMWGLSTHMTPTPTPIANSDLQQGEQQFFSGSPHSLHLLEFFRWKSSFLLEQQTIQQRYRQANLTLLSRLWIKYAGFLTGMILAFVGSIFIVGKLQEPRSTVEGSSSGLALSVHTASPGLVLCILGTVLMMTTHMVHQQIETYDVAVYTKPVSWVPTSRYDWNLESEGTRTPEEILQDIGTELTSMETNGEIDPRHIESIREAWRKAKGSPSTQNLVVP